MKYIVNPGVNPELRYAARALSQFDECKYFTTFVFGTNSRYERLVSRFSTKSKIHKFLNRRLIDLEDEIIVRNGLIWEMAQVAARAKFPEFQRYCLKKRNQSIHKQVRNAAKGDFPDVALIHYTQSSETIELLKSLNCVTILNYPIAHHGWMEQMLEFERRINPNLIDFLQVPQKFGKESENLSQELELCEFILVGSSFVRDTFLAQGVPARKVIVINLGMNPKEFQIEVLNQYDFVNSKRKLRLVFTGQITQRKGLSYLFEALKSFEESVECLIIGLAPDSNYLSQFHLPRNIEFLGYKSKYEMSDIYSSCDVFVFPSLAEGFPLSAIEAMAHGLSLIITSNTFASDVIANYSEGIVIEPHNAEQIVKSIKFYLDHPESIQKFGIAAKERSLQFNWGRYEQKIIQFVSEISNG
jgi:glycosyltransferase involved in cell wall biosynthesis